MTSAQAVPAGPRRGSAAAFTLVEMTIVLAILGIISGMAVVVYGRVGATSDEQAIQGECATVRTACLRFRADVGRPPHLIAELLQEPATWWWSADRPASWDAAIRRGWNGPYLAAERSSAGGDPAEESRLLAGGSYERHQSSSSNPLAILVSQYGSHPQDGSGGRWKSHFQLEESAVDGLVVRFVHDPAAAAPGDSVVRLPTGLAP